MDVMEKLVELLKEVVAIQECGFGDPRPTYETVASYLIDNGVTVQEWIPVTERLPEEYKAVFVCYKSGTVYINYIRQGGKWNCIGDDITHWMPLPEPPKED